MRYGGTYNERYKKCIQNFSWRHVDVRDHSRDLNGEERITLNQVFKKIRLEEVEGINLTQHREVASFCDHRHEPSCSIK